MGQVRPRQRKAIGRLTAHPAESEQPGAEINHLLFFLFRSLLKDSCLKAFLKSMLLRLVDWSARGETPAGRVGQVRLLMAQSGRRLTARPAESEQPGAEINHPQIFLI
ncbi:hypothetical protein ABE41_017705 [Fictibacillus arsenicus]|uniref:Uncharacterized protein n=1 Tax=Fictibacillus arsenicus TaxID=255247 RepID=A0A1B1Z8U2_9BACL|nr:hypothetical protein ABE41_017705 [Fictibacillus arsenicus]